MINIANFLLPLLQRIINKYTPVGIINILVGVALLSLGASEDLVKWGVTQNFNNFGLVLFSILNFLLEHKVITTVLTLFFLSIGGFYFWRMDLGKSKILRLKNEVEILELENKIKKLKGGN